MTKMRNPLTFLFVAFGAALFVAVTGLTLPDPVASHFSPSGAANGFMPRGLYIGFLVGIVIGLPALLIMLTWLAMGRSSARINLPDPGYWLAPERRARTIAWLRGGVLRFGVLLMVFLCYAHWLVVRANAAVPIRLAQSWLIGGLVIFLVATVIQVALLLGRFRRRGT